MKDWHDHTPDDAALAKAKAVVLDFYAALDRGPAKDALAKHCAPDLIWRGYHPFNELHGADVVAETFWAPLKSALTPMQRRLDLFFAGLNEIDGFSSVWVASMGHLMGLFDAPWLGIPPTRKIAMLRYAAFHKVVDGRIAETAMYFDLPHLVIQAGLQPFPHQTAAELVQPGPVTHGGLLVEGQPAEEAEATLAAMNRMINDLKQWGARDKDGIVEELRRSWNDDMIWWGPTGIGATYTVDRYAEQHAGPFRNGFSDRMFKGHLCRIAEGHFGGFFGWPNMTLKPSGAFMGMPATGKVGELRVIDMYRRSGDKLSENWVFIDFLHFWKQQGIDILARVTR